MILFKKSIDIQKYLELLRRKSYSIGFVPTMGALHEGHASLMRLSKAANEITIVSIFVNPLQFNDKTDYLKYPVTIENDLMMLSRLDVDVVFLPDEKDIYPDGEPAPKTYDLGSLETIMEGSSRPGHFQGVACVMDILLHIVSPTHLYLGQKDFQQVRVIQRLIDLENLPAKIIEAPLIRERSGLAMSSRNERLDASARKTAALLFEGLQYIQHNADAQSFATLKNSVIAKLQQAGFSIDYIVLADRDSLEILDDFDNTKRMILLAAVFLNGIRLIDNLRLDG